MRTVLLSSTELCLRSHPYLKPRSIQTKLRSIRCSNNEPNIAPTFQSIMTHSGSNFFLQVEQVKPLQKNLQGLQPRVVNVFWRLYKRPALAVRFVRRSLFGSHFFRLSFCLRLLVVAFLVRTAKVGQFLSLFLCYADTYHIRVNSQRNHSEETRHEY